MFGTYRTILALLVVTLHIGGVPKLGAYAVFGFYCLSGYLMTLILQKTYGYTRKGFFNYLINRFLRIYPLYWFSIVFSLILIFIIGEEHTSNYHKAIYLPDQFIDVLKNIFLIFPYRDLPRLTPASWALTIELFFYLLIGLGLSKHKKITMIWFAFGVTYHVMALTLDLGWKQRYFTVFAASLPFSLGALLFHFKDNMKALLKLYFNKNINYLACIVMTMIFINWLLGYLLNSLATTFFYTNLILCASMIPILINVTELSFISKRFDKKLGTLSYPIYLIHEQVGMIMLIILGYLGFQLNSPSIILLLASIPAILLLSMIMFLSIDKPIEKLRFKIKSQSKV